MTASAVTELNRLKYKISIDGHEIYHDWIATLVMNWTLKNNIVSGSMTFFDQNGYNEHIPLGTFNTLKVKLEDVTKTEFEYQFTITDVYSTSSNEKHKTITVRFVDIMTYTGSQVYKSKGYIGKNAKQIAGAMIGEYMNVASKQYGQDFEDGNTYDTYILNGSMSVNRNLVELFRRQGLILYKDRTGIMAKYPHQLMANPCKADLYTVNYGNDRYLFKIDSWEYADNFVIDTSIPNEKRHWFTPFDKTLQMDCFDESGAEAEYNACGGAAGSYAAANPLTWEYTTESGNGKANYLNPKHLSYNKFMEAKMNKKLIEVFTGGHFALNVGMLIKLELVRESTEVSDKDENLSGQWLVVELTDNISTSAFYQTVKLARIHNQK